MQLIYHTILDSKDNIPFQKLKYYTNIENSKWKIDWKQRKRKCR